MAKKPPKTGKALVIVESPAKARTISKFFGGDYVVEASIGHVRDLAQGKKEVPEQYRDEPWAKLAVNVEDRFQPVYIVPDAKKQQVTKLKRLLKESSEIYLATDEDREGEAISWHLCELLQPKVPVHRLVFHEITREAIQHALDHPRTIDEQLVRAQETRRILDRLYGWGVSELVQKKAGAKSAGRVQTVVLRLLVQRERERMAFVSASYWDLLGKFASQAGQDFQAELASVDGRRLPQGKDFDSTTGRIKSADLLLLDESGAKQLAERLRGADYQVTAVERRPYTTKPSAPFTTSTLQQEANRKLGFTAKRTMSVAQSLYENGYITYMRTDSTNPASEAVDAARTLVQSEYGQEYLPPQPRTYASKVKNAQEAHEAIRPAGHPFRLPDSLKAELSSDQFRLFELIWKRTIASQMNDARGHYITITVEGGGAVFQVRGKTIDFPGFLRAYVEGSDDPRAELADKEKILPNLQQGDPVLCQDMEVAGHTTKPPARFSEAALTRQLEELGIGRPSTYAAIIETIQARTYAFKKGNALVPTWIGFAVCRLMEEHLPTLVDYQFTAQMEDFLDTISRGEAGHVEYLRQFYFGEDRQPGLKQKLDVKLEEVNPKELRQFEIGRPENQPPVLLQVGRFGPYVEQGELGTEAHRKASVPSDLPPDELTVEKALELLNAAQVADEPLGVCPETGRNVYLKHGRFGHYVQLGEPDDESGEPTKNASLLQGIIPEELTLETALKLLSLPRVVGVHPETNEPVEASNGRYGPFIRSGKETRSLAPGQSPLEVTLAEALELLKQPSRRGRQAAPKEPLKVFQDKSPVTEEEVKVLDGRWGPYVTDGTTNASLPRGMKPEEMTFNEALDLLAVRAASGPKKKASKKKAAKAPKKSTGAKSAKKAAKKSAAKKPAAKKSAGKKKSS